MILRAKELFQEAVATWFHWKRSEETEDFQECPRTSALAVFCYLKLYLIYF